MNKIFVSLLLALLAGPLFAQAGDAGRGNQGSDSSRPVGRDGTQITQVGGCTEKIRRHPENGSPVCGPTPMNLTLTMDRAAYTAPANPRLNVAASGFTVVDVACDSGYNRTGFRPINAQHDLGVVTWPGVYTCTVTGSNREWVPTGEATTSTRLITFTLDVPPPTPFGLSGDLNYGAVAYPTRPTRSITITNTSPIYSVAPAVAIPPDLAPYVSVAGVPGALGPGGSATLVFTFDSAALVNAYLSSLAGTISISDPSGRVSAVTVPLTASVTGAPVRSINASFSNPSPMLGEPISLNWTSSNLTGTGGVSCNDGSGINQGAGITGSIPLTAQGSGGSCTIWISANGVYGDVSMVTTTVSYGIAPGCYGPQPNTTVSVSCDTPYGYPTGMVGDYIYREAYVCTGSTWVRSGGITGAPIQNNCSCPVGTLWDGSRCQPASNYQPTTSVNLAPPSIVPGQTSTLSWASSQADVLTVDCGGGAVAQPASGSAPVTLGAPGSMTCTVFARNNFSGLTSTSQITLSAACPAEAPWTGTACVVPPPVITGFGFATDAAPMVANGPNSNNLSWTVTNAANVTLSCGNSANVSSTTVPSSGALLVQPGVAGPVDCVITADNAGGSVSRSARYRACQTDQTWDGARCADNAAPPPPWPPGSCPAPLYMTDFSVVGGRRLCMEGPSTLTYPHLAVSIANSTNPALPVELRNPTNSLFDRWAITAYSFGAGTTRAALPGESPAPDQVFPWSVTASPPSGFQSLVLNPGSRSITGTTGSMTFNGEGLLFQSTTPCPSSDNAWCVGNGFIFYAIYSGVCSADAVVRMPRFQSAADGSFTTLSPIEWDAVYGNMRLIGAPLLASAWGSLAWDAFFRACEGGTDLWGGAPLSPDAQRTQAQAEARAEAIRNRTGGGGGRGNRN